MAELLRFFFLLLLFSLSALASDCDDMTTCNSCVNKRSWNPFASCRWCSLDRKCHTFGALLTNPCSTDMNIKDDEDCPSENDIYAEYETDLAYEQVFMSAVAYTDEPDTCMDKLKLSHDILDSDIEIISIIARSCDDWLFDYRECAVVIGLSNNRKSIYVSFRGSTATAQVLDQLVSILFEPKNSLGEGHVQEYFLEAYEKLSFCLTNHIEELKKLYPDFTVRFSGHSLGGALASIAAFKFIQEGKLSKDEVTLYTYGMPRVGDKLYAAEHDRRVDSSFRLVNYKDCVPHFPTCRVSCSIQGETGPYHHRTEVFYDTSSMLPESAYKVCHGNEDADCSHKYQGPVASIININNCFDSHVKYFGIPIGDFCDQQSGRRRKRSESSDIGYLLSNDYCEVLQRQGDQWAVVSTGQT
ncbi:lipase ZK262.3-like [Watersipora subatra]|uniref:lipase ZK262.3-like n=1 Tax=Watersipora subatra TaxID=2589382 RepID=UPI00355C18B6